MLGGAMFVDMECEPIVFVAAAQAELEDLDMLYIQLASKFLFHCDFHSKKTLR